MFREPVVRRVAQAAVTLFVLVGFGSVGYALVEGWSLADGFFMTIITVSTVGYGETHELSAAGRIFTAGLIMFCVVGMTLLTASLTSFILESDLSGRYARKRTQKMISKLKNHTIVCGSGPLAETVVERLVRERVDVVVIGENNERIESLRRRFGSLLFLEGYATSELLLAKAGIFRASSVVAALDSEVDNLLVCITCKDMGRQVAVFARCNDTTIANRMRKAGADEVISPNQLCGDRIAGLICSDSRPATTESIPQLIES